MPDAALRCVVYHVQTYTWLTEENVDPKSKVRAIGNRCGQKLDFLAARSKPYMLCSTHLPATKPRWMETAFSGRYLRTGAIKRAPVNFVKVSNPEIGRS